MVYPLAKEDLPRSQVTTGVHEDKGRARYVVHFRRIDGIVEPFDSYERYIQVACNCNQVHRASRTTKESHEILQDILLREGRFVRLFWFVNVVMIDL